MSIRFRHNRHPSNKKDVCDFRHATFDLLTDFLENINRANKERLNSLSKSSGCFKSSELIDYIFQVTEDLALDPEVGYHALELLEKFMITHLIKLLREATPQGAAAASPVSREDAVFNFLKVQFPLIIFSCVQIASKLSSNTNFISYSTALRLLQSVGHNATRKTLLDSELMVLKGLDFRLDVCHPLTYVEVLLEVLAYNEPSIPIEDTYDLCLSVLHFVVLERKAIFENLLKETTKSQQPSSEQREEFLSVTEDHMLLGVAVVAVAIFIFDISQWRKVVEELSNMTGISTKSIFDFAHVTLWHIGRPLLQ